MRNDVTIQIGLDRAQNIEHKNIQNSFKIQVCFHLFHCGTLCKVLSRHLYLPLQLSLSKASPTLLLHVDPSYNLSVLHLPCSVL